MADFVGTLRRAAQLMRERAEAVRAGANEPDMWFGADEIVNELMWGDQPQHGDVQADAQHIASWQPAVALAVAAWLQQAAMDLWAHGPLCPSCKDGCDECDDALWMPHVRKALDLAEAYLGEEGGRG